MSTRSWRRSACQFERYQSRDWSGDSHSGMLSWSPRAAGAAASASARRWRVCFGSMTSSTTPMATALPTPPATRSCSAANRSCNASRSASGAAASCLRCRTPTAALAPHHGDLGLRPREHRRGTQRPRVHRDVRAAVGLPGHQRHPRHHGRRERVQQFRAPPHDAVPLLTDAGQVTGHVDQHHHRHPERVAHPHEPRRLLRRQRVQAAALAQRVVREHADRPAGQPPEPDDHVACPQRLEFLEALDDLADQRMYVIRPFRLVGQ